MGDSKVTKSEIFDLARQMAGDINESNGRIHGLANAFDCLVTVLDEHFCPAQGGAEEKFQKPITKAVKAEIQRRIEAAKTKAAPPLTPCECCGEPGNDGSMPYGIYCNPCGNDVAHPTGTGGCYVEDGREHKHRGTKPDFGDGPYDPTSPVNIAAHEKAKRERTGCYAPGASDDPDK